MTQIPAGAEETSAALQAEVPHVDPAGVPGALTPPMCGAAGTQERCCETCVHIEVTDRSGKCGACVRSGAAYAEWQPMRRTSLTDEQLDELAREVWSSLPIAGRLFRFARAVERAHGIGEA